MDLFRIELMLWKKTEKQSVPLPDPKTAVRSSTGSTGFSQTAGLSIPDGSSTQPEGLDGASGTTAPIFLEGPTAFPALVTGPTTILQFIILLQTLQLIAKQLQEA